MKRKIEYFKTISKGKVISVTLIVTYPHVLSKECTIMLTNNSTGETMTQTVSKHYIAVMGDILKLAKFEMNNNSQYSDNNFKERIQMVERMVKKP